MVLGAEVSSQELCFSEIMLWGARGVWANKSCCQGITESSSYGNDSQYYAKACNKFGGAHILGFAPE